MNGASASEFMEDILEEWKIKQWLEEDLVSGNDFLNIGEAQPIDRFRLKIEYTKDTVDLESSRFLDH